MTSEAKKLLEQALRLSPADRKALAGQLFDSLATDAPNVAAAWQAEIKQRLSEMDRGKVKPIPWAKAKRRIFGDADDAARD